MPKLIVELPTPLHESLKRFCFEKKETIRSIVTKLLENTLHTAKSERLKQGTECCGIWQDDRSAREIAQEIRSHRFWFKTRS